MKIYIYMTVNLSIYYLQKLFIFFIYAWPDADVWLRNKPQMTSSHFLDGYIPNLQESLPSILEMID